MSTTITDFFSLRRWNVMSLFLGRNYRQDLPLRRRDIYEWQFLAEAYGGNACMVCAWRDDRLVGILGYMPTPVFWGDFERPQTAAWTANWVVEQDCRHGLGWALLRRLQERFAIVLGVGASAQNERIVRRLGWRFWPRLPRYLCVLDGVEAVHMLGPDAGEEDLRPMLCRTPLRTVPSLRGVGPDGEGYTPDWHLYPAMAYGTIRSIPYLRWRYFGHRVFEYVVVACGPADRPAVCVYRIERAFGYYRALVGRIVEFFHPNDPKGKADGLAIISGVMAQLRALGCTYADLTCSSGAYGETLLEAGWGEEPADRQILPVRLCPIERTIRHQNLECGIAPGVPSPSLEAMYVTKSDGDEDRPATLIPHLSRPHLDHARG